MSTHVSHASHGSHDSHDSHLHEMRSTRFLGFWVFLISDCLLFASLFATYMVLRLHTDGGPTAKEVFDVKDFTIETLALLTSSFTSGLAILSLHKKNKAGLNFWLIITIALGLVFIGYEVNEFYHMASTGAPISRSAFLTSFFVLVGTHGCHVSLGIMWMISLIIQYNIRGIDDMVTTKLMTISLYWHFLDIVWVFIFTVVYMLGVAS